MSVERRTRLALGFRLPARIQADGRPGMAPRRLALLGTALAVLGLCVALHLWRLDSAPGWDPQEGYNLDIAWNLVHGRLRLFALISAFAQHPPLFYLQLAFFIRLFGYRILAVRALAAVYAILTCAALLGCGWRLAGAGAALWAGLLFIAAPLLLDNTRWGYSYVQLAFVGVLCLWALSHSLERADPRWLMVAAGLAGLAACSDYTGIAWIALVALVALRQSWRAALLALGIGVGVLAVESLACVAIAPNVFLADVATTLGRAAGGNLLAQGIELLLSYYRLLTFDPVVLLGVVGLFLVRDARARGLLLAACALLALVTLKVRPLGASFHTAVPLLPLLALGAGVALDRALRTLYSWMLHWLRGLDLALPAAFAPALRGRFARPSVAMLSTASPAASASADDPASTPRAPGRLVRIAAALVVFLAVVSPVGMALALDAAQIAHPPSTTGQDATLATPSDAQAAISYVLGHTHAGDLVLASPTLAWAFDAPEDTSGHPRGLQGADVLQTVAQAGHAAAFYPAGLPATRWAYNVSLDRARYVIVDNLVRQLAVPNAEPSLVPMLASVRQWPAIYSQGQYTIYEQPGT
jgi:4-amino-4-deoxy-L-arabinose transferase-like glycosyltransferase